MGTIPERAYMAWLRGCLKLRESTFRRLVARYETAETVFLQAKSGCFDLPEGWLNLEEISTLRTWAALENIEKTWQHLQQKKIGVVVQSDALYPPSFLDLHDAPYILYMRGRKETLMKQERLCVVGMREASEYGIKTARHISRQWAKAGGCVVSGLALGVDAAAHRGALEGCDLDSTIAVLTGGLDRAQPRANEALFDDIRERGLLISENPPGYAIQKWSIPYRNRLMAALCQGVLLVEARHRSGTQHTVAVALDLGREVFAVPGRIDCEESQLPNQLIRDGAVIYNQIEDILDFYPSLQERAAQKKKSDQKKIKMPIEEPLSPSEMPTESAEGAPIRSDLVQNECQALIVALLSQEPLSLEELVMRCQFPVAVVLKELSLLMSRGLIDMDESGSKYRM